jgi:hypothetical protein
LSERDAAFFALPPGVFFHYPSSWNWPLTILAAAMLLGVLFFAKGAFETRLSGVILGFLVCVGTLVFFALAGFGFVWAVQWLHSRWLPEGSTLQSIPYLLSMFALLAAAGTALFLWLREKLRGAALPLGGFALMLLAVAATARWLPAAHAFLWPLLCARQPRARWLSPVSRGGLPFQCPELPVLVILPALHGFFEALGFSALGGPILGLSFALFFILILPLTDALVAAGRRSIPIGALVLAVCFFTVGAVTTRYSDANPNPTMMSYTLAEDTAQTMWAHGVAARSVDCAICRNISHAQQTCGLFPTGY